MEQTDLRGYLIIGRRYEVIVDDDGTDFRQNQKYLVTKQVVDARDLGLHRDACLGPGDAASTESRILN